MKYNTFKSTIPHLIALLTFVIISFAYCYPVLEGKRLNAHDSKVFESSSKEIKDYRSETGKEALWTNSMFGGMPAYLISAKFPGNLIKNIDNVFKIFKTPVAAIFLAFLGFYVLLLLYRVKPWLAMAGALAYGLTSFLFVSLSAGHNTKVYAMVYMAPVIGSAIYTLRNNAFRGAVLFAFFFALQIMANHVQIVYYTGITLLIFGIFELVYSIKEKTLLPLAKAVGMLFIAAIFALGVNFASLYTTWEYSKVSTRGKSDLEAKASEENGLDKGYITYWSYGIPETLTLLVPDFRGGASKQFGKDSETLKALRKNNMAQASQQLFQYWGNQPSTSGPVYFGAIILFLFIIGLMIVPPRDRWWILTAVLLSIFLSWGKNLMFLTSLFVDVFPGYNKFRAVTMILVIAGVCVPLLAILALKEIFNGNVQREKALVAVKRAASITGGLALIFFLLPGLAGSFLSPDEASIPDSYNWLKNAMIADRKMMLRTDAIRSVLLIAAGSSFLWLFLKNKIKTTHLLIALPLLFLIDQAPVDMRYLGKTNFVSVKEAQKELQPSNADRIIMQDTSEYRVLNLSVSTFNDASTSYYHHSIGGYHGAKIKRYQELIESSIITEMNALITCLQSAKSLQETDEILSRSYAINMLNTKYIILRPDQPPLYNKYALGNAWLTQKATIVENADEELKALKTINPASEAIIDRKFESLLPLSLNSKAISDTIYLVSYKPNELVYKSNLASEQLAVFSEIYYPDGWKVFIDDKPGEHFRADYILRAMIVPPGEHTIRFYFEPQSYKTGNTVSMVFSTALLILLALALINGVISSGKNG